MRILFLSHYFYPEANAPARRVYELCRRWSAAGHQVAVITGVPNVPLGVPYSGYRNRLLSRELVDGVRVLRVWTWLAPNRGVVRRSLNYISFMLAGSVAGIVAPVPEVVIATTPQLLCGVAGRVVARLKAAVFVLDVRDLWPASVSAVGALRHRGILNLLARVERSLYRSADQIVCVGEGYARQVAQAGGQGKIAVVPNGVDLDRFAPEHARVGARRRFGIPEDAFVCMYAGTVGMACGLDVVLEAAARLKDEGRTDTFFVIAGEGARKEELQSESIRRGLETVIFLGRVPGGEVPELLGCADVCLVHLSRHPLFRSVLPSKMYEAAAMGKPLLVGVEGEAAEWVKHARAGLCFTPGDARELLKALEQLRNDAELRRVLGENGRKYVEKEHDYDKLAARYLEILEGVIGSGNGDI